MPSDFLTEYRHRLQSFHTELYRDAYQFHSGQQEAREINHLRSEYSDLWSATACAELQRELDELAAYRETERAALQRLLAFATHEQMQTSGRELNAEISAYETRATLQWEGEPLHLTDVAQLLRQEPEPQKRHELAARRRETLKTIEDLRAERWEKLHEKARAGGAENYLVLYRNLRGVDYQALATQTQAWLAQTESKFVAAFAPLLAREANITLNAATADDLPAFTQLTRFDPQFPAWQLPHAYRETFSGLGILTYQQNNLTIDDAVRPQKNARAAHFPIRVPDEIKISYTPRAGVRPFAAFLRESGRAQQYAWMSHQLHPEFHHCGDAAVRQGFALLFGQLPHDPRWLADLLNLSESQELRQLLAIQRLLQLRHCAAQLRYETEFHTGQYSGSAAVRYSELLTEAMRVRVDDTEHLRSVTDGLAVADQWRAYALEAQLREYLKTKFGSRWWASRKAGDFLIDLWNTGGRYPAEELARLIDLGELSFDWLAEDCLMQLSF